MIGDLSIRAMAMGDGSVDAWPIGTIRLMVCAGGRRGEEKEKEKDVATSSGGDGWIKSRVARLEAQDGGWSRGRHFTPPRFKLHAGSVFSTLAS